MKQIIIVLLVIVGFTSCKKSLITPQKEVGQVLIAVKSSKLANANAVASRAKSVDGFGAISQIGIYTTLTPSKDLSIARNVNVGYYNTGTTYWSANDVAQSIYHVEDGGALSFFAYHPYTGQPKSTVSLVGLSVAPTLNYNLPTNQSTEETLVLADLMWGNENGVKEVDGAAKIEFQHMLTKVTLNVRKGEDWGAEEAQVSNIKIYGSAIATNAKLDLSLGDLRTTPVADGSNNAIECVLTQPEAIGETNMKTFDFIALPANDIAGLTLEFVVNGASYRTVLNATNIPDPENRTFRAATNRVFGITINRYNPDQLYVIPSIVAWNVISEIDIEGI